MKCLSHFETCKERVLQTIGLESIRKSHALTANHCQIIINWHMSSMANPSRDMRLSSLFGGTRFWLSAHVPTRDRFKQMIKEHGGVVVLLEKDSNVMLVDHTKSKNIPPGKYYSYRYVENSVRNGRLENLEDHRVGPSAQRPVGASHIPKKATRSEYTLADDQILWDWLHKYEQEEGAPVSGNTIYKQIAEKFPQHTYQSWRARYLKVLRPRHRRPGGGEPRSHAELLGQSQVPEQPEPQLELKPKPARIPAAAKQVQVSETAQTTSTSGSGDSHERREADDHVQKLPQAATATESSAAQKPQKAPKPPAEQNQSGVSGVNPQDQVDERYRKSSSTSSHRNRPHMSPPTSPSHASGRRGSQGILYETSEAMDSLAHNLLTTPRRRRKCPVQPESHTQISSSPKLLSSEAPPSKRASQEFATTADVLRLWKPPEHLASQLMSKDLSSFTLPMPPSPEPNSDEDVETGGTDDQESYSDVDSWIDAQVQRGAEESTVLEALQCTSMLPEYAEQFLKHYADGNGVPTNMRGVWTAEDDKGLEGSDQRVIEKLYEKHGADLVNYRLEYLSMARDE